MFTHMRFQNTVTRVRTVSVKLHLRANGQTDRRTDKKAYLFVRLSVVSVRGEILRRTKPDAS